jgi:hypothetical protein
MFSNPWANRYYSGLVFVSVVYCAVIFVVWCMLWVCFMFVGLFQAVLGCCTTYLCGMCVFAFVVDV